MAVDALERRPLDLLALDPRSNYGSDIPALETKLPALRDDLRAEADDRGWEVD